MSDKHEKLICDSIVEVKNLIEECKSVILGSVDQADPLPDNLQVLVDDLVEANFIYDELIRQLLH